MKFLLVAALAACGTTGPHGGGDDGSGNCAPLGAGGVETLSGGAQAGFMDGDHCTALFHNPVNVAIGAGGKVYVADFDNGKIREIDPSSGATSTVIAQQGFSRPFALAFGPSGALYVATDNDPNNQHSVMSGTVWKVDVSAKKATPLAVDIGRPRAMFVMSDGRIAATDYENHVVEIIDPNSGAVTNLAGAFGQAGFADGAAATARFSAPYGIVQRADGKLVVVDQANNKLRLVGLDGTVSTLAGSSAGFADGTMPDVKFSSPQALAIDGSDNIYLTDISNRRIRKISGNAVSTFAGDGMDGFADDTDPQGAEFHGIEGLAVTKDGKTVYVADGTGGEDVPYNRVREITVQ